MLAAAGRQRSESRSTVGFRLRLLRNHRFWESVVVGSSLPAVRSIIATGSSSQFRIAFEMAGLGILGDLPLGLFPEPPIFDNLATFRRLFRPITGPNLWS
jgi:hypothetical protein